MIFLELKTISICSRYPSKRTVNAGKPIGTGTDVLDNFIFEKSDADWLDVLNSA